MAKTVVGLFDSFAEAQNVVQELVDNGFTRDDISIVSNDASQRSEYDRTVGHHDENAAAEGAGTGAVSGSVLGGALGLLVGAGLLAIPGIGPVLAAGPLAAGIGTAAATIGAGAAGAGIGAATGGLIGGLVGTGVPKEDAEYYAEGVRRGGTLVSVSANDAMAARAHDVMVQYNAVDIENRSTEWRSSGWTGFGDQTERVDRTDVTTGATTDYPGTTVRDNTLTDTTLGGDRSTNTEEVLPVVQEEIEVDKQRVEQGGVRVSTEVHERPVEETVTLRDERVNVERRAVDRPVTDADAAAFQETSFELQESTEQPVVHKRARVVEEVVINRDVTSHQETVRDTVRHTHVNVDQTSTGSDRDVSVGATGGSGYDAYTSDYRDHYQRTFGSTDYTYDDYAPVYRYGHSLASDQRYQGRDWSEIEGDARSSWEQHNPGTWEQFKDSVRYAWDKARGQR